MGVHELEEARVRENVRRGYSKGEDQQREVRPVDRKPEERVHERERALRHDESRQEPRRQGFRSGDAVGIPSQVNLTYLSLVLFSRNNGIRNVSINEIYVESEYAILDNKL